MRTLFKSLFFTLFIGSFLISCNNNKTSKEENKADSTGFKLDPVAFSKLSSEPASINIVNQAISLTGKITYNQDKVVKVFPLVGGHIEDVKVELGAYVQKGQILAIIRSGDMADIQQQSTSAKSNYAIAEKNLQVAQDMSKAGLSSQKDLVAAQEGLAAAKAEVNRTTARKNILGGSGTLYYVKAPNSGFIVEKTAATGMELRNDDPENLFTISNLDNVWVMANVYESDIANIHLGQEVKITTISFPDKVYTGKIDKIFNTLDPQSKTEKVRIQLSNQDYQLKPEMFANILVEYGGKEQKLSVPSKAVIFDNNENYVIIKQGTDLVIKPISIYKVVGDKTFLNSGVEVGQEVVTQNQLTLFQALQN